MHADAHIDLAHDASSAGSKKPHVVVVGAGFTGLAAAFDLTRQGVAVTVLEAEDEAGGLAASFSLEGGARIERFYHHWFTSDRHVMQLIADLGASGEVTTRATRTAVYRANRMYRLATPLDLLRFSALSPLDRLRLGWLALRARMVRDWRALEHISAERWLIRLAGENVYRVVWEPLLRGKFGALAPEVSAVWIWNKLKLRGGSRGKDGAEHLAYYRGGFSALVARLEEAIRAAGGRILTGTAATGLACTGGRVQGVASPDGVFACDAALLTTPLPVVAELMSGPLGDDAQRLYGRIEHLGNVCLILELDRSLSESYWLNVNDPSFPFVGVIEHTNFEPASSYGGRRLVYLSRYLPTDDPFYRLDDDATLAHCMPYLQTMFPHFERSWIRRHHVWRARHAQPVVRQSYATLIPPRASPVAGVFVASMAQIYPEDRGTNYAVREGRAVAADLATWLAAQRRNMRSNP